jgi:hypothetical protein
MAFKTRTDLSFNRQAKQREGTEWILPGVTRFGLPEGELAVGPDLNKVKILVPSYQNEISTFTGNTDTGVYNYTWALQDMEKGLQEVCTDCYKSDDDNWVRDFTLDDSEGTEHYVGPIWWGIDPLLDETSGEPILVNGRPVYTKYLGIQYDMTVAEPITDLGGGDISGSIRSNIDFLEAEALDYSGDYIWVDVRGTTLTESLIISQVGLGSASLDLMVDDQGKVVTSASDERLKENVLPIQNALEKVLGLKGISYQWKDRKSGGDAVRLGFIAQDVQQIVPELVYNTGKDDYLGVHYTNAIPLIIEAIKELAENRKTSTNSEGEVKQINTEVIYSEDNAIELNYNGTHETAKNGGIILIKGVSEEENAHVTTNENGDWEFHPNISISEYTPSSTQDTKGHVGNLTFDDDFLYIRTTHGWKRTRLENF